MSSSTAIENAKMDVTDESNQWREREVRLLFSRYDNGCVVSDVMVYSVTREADARRKAKRAYALLGPEFTTVVDACSGAGGDTIAMLQEGYEVYSIDINPENLAAAKNNARVYSCEEFVKQFVLGDMLDLEVYRNLNPLPDFSKTLLHASPEWGGQGYKRFEVFDMNCTRPPVPAILEVFEAMKFGACCLYLPKTADIDQLKSWGCTQIDYFYRASKLSAICAWWLPETTEEESE